MTESVIMLVEDEPDDEFLAMRALAKPKLVNQIVVVRDGQEALDYLLNESRPLPAFVLLDLKLPKVSGLEVLQRLRANQRTAILPVVILTVSEEEQDVRDGYRLGCNSYMRKPGNFAQFADAMKHLTIFWLALNEPHPKTGHPDEPIFARPAG